MDCCCSGVQLSKETAQNDCDACGVPGRVVARQTVAHHLKSGKLTEIKSPEYRFCPSEKCSTVYYSGSGEVYSVDDLRELVTLKTTGDDRPICYCFGFTEGIARKEIAETGKSTVSQTVSQLMKERLCQCEIRNPVGACCLGEVNKTIKRLVSELI